MTGTQPAKPMSVAAPDNRDLDSPTDPRQSTLYGWWNSRRISFDRLEGILRQAEEILGAWRTEGPQNQPLDQQRSIAEFSNLLQHLTNLLEQTTATVQAARIPVSLERFERKFWSHQKSQLWRWLALDFLLPALLGIVALWGSCHLANASPMPSLGALKMSCAP